MKPRKKDESDASYISRLEAANNDLRQSNKKMGEQMALYNERARPAAVFTRAVLLGASEACGLRDDARVAKVADALADLAALPWSRNLPDAGEVFGFPPATETLRGDAEMILCSIYERVLGETGSFSLFDLFRGLPPRKAEMALAIVGELLRLAQENLEGQARAVIGRPPRPLPAYVKPASLEDAQALFDALRHEIWLLFEDLEMSRDMLRLDLRASMYEAIARGMCRIAGAASEAADALSRAPVQDGPSIPF